MPNSGHTELAKVFLSGLIERRLADTEDPHDVVYDFRRGVRSELLGELTRREAVRVLEDVLAKVSGRIAAPFGGTLDFRALAAHVAGTGSAGGTRELPERSLPFAEVAATVLSDAAGCHEAIARQLCTSVSDGVPRLPSLVPSSSPSLGGSARPTPRTSSAEPRSSRPSKRGFCRRPPSARHWSSSRDHRA
ncbi:hypothetical protein ACWGIV_36620 [Streptomyces sp. NPDC054844]